MKQRRQLSAFAMPVSLGWMLLALMLVLTVEVSAAAEPIVLADDRGHTLRLAAPAQRVVTLLPSMAEVVCELQACARLVGTDRHANWPESVRALPKLGGLEDTQIERLVALKPELVLAARSARALDRLQALGVPVLALEPQNLADLERAYGVVARALGTPAAAPIAVARLRERLDAAAAHVPAAWRGRSVYFEVASTPHAAGAASFVGEVLARLGLVNAVPAALGPFPALAPEFILRAEPALVVGSRQAVAQMPARPGWDRLAALRSRRWCAFDPVEWDSFVRPGPRLADGAEALARCLVALPAP